MTQLPGLAGTIEDLIGLDLTVKLLKARGGTDVKIPEKPQNTLLGEIVGHEAAQILIDELPPGVITLPCSHMRGRDADRMDRKRRAIGMLLEGKSLREVALACDIHLKTAKTYRAEIKDGRHGKPDQGELPL